MTRQKQGTSKGRAKKALSLYNWTLTVWHLLGWIPMSSRPAYTCFISLEIVLLPNKEMFGQQTKYPRSKVVILSLIKIPLKWISILTIFSCLHVSIRNRDPGLACCIFFYLTRVTRLKKAPCWRIKQLLQAILFVPCASFNRDRHLVNYIGWTPLSLCPLCRGSIDNRDSN